MSHFFDVSRVVVRTTAILATVGGVSLGAAACTPSATTPTATPAPVLSPDATGRPTATVPAPASRWFIRPGSPLSREQRHWVDSTLASLSLRQRVGQMTWIWVLGDYTNAHDSTFEQVRRWIVDDQVGGATMSLGSPIEVGAKINAMQRLARVPLLISSDVEPNLGRLEGGVFDYYLMNGGSATVIPTNMAIGATGQAANAYAAGRIIGQESRAIGILLAFAPVVDVNNNPANPVINTRSYGENPRAVAAMAAEFVRGIQDEGVAATAKHFPGHGDTDVDSHTGLPVVPSNRQRLEEVELVPFRGAINEGVAGVMSAHIALPAVEKDSTPATLAPAIMTGLLRDTLGFRGLAITDALTMEGVGKGYNIQRSSVLAVKAGDDVLLKPSDVTAAIDAVVAAVERGEISPERIERSARAVLELKARVGLDRNRWVDLDRLREVVGAPEHWAVAERIAQQALTLIRDRDNLLPLASGQRVAVITYTPENELRAGRELTAAVRGAISGTKAFRVDPTTTQSQLDSISAQVHGFDRVIVSTHVRRVEGAGRPTIPGTIATWIDGLAQREKVVVVANGNPYVIRQFPSVGTYLQTYAVNSASERAAVQAMLGKASITGRAPISLPGFFQVGDGIQRMIQP